MPPTEISKAAFKLALGECYDAIKAGRLADAKRWYALAEVQHAGLSAGVSADGVSVARRQSLDAVAKAIEIAEAADGGGSRPWELTSRLVP
ncbi:MAG: hypothetical protein KIT58_03110 [Planctomycetota bacterium]|nr:hypothetical protein [Planctomycetota bacterium]